LQEKKNIFLLLNNVFYAIFASVKIYKEMKKSKVLLLLIAASFLFAACASHHCHNRYGRYKHSEVIEKTVLNDSSFRA